MSLDKAIQHGKEHRKHYRHSKRADNECRNHGRCPLCMGNRTHRNTKRKLSADERMEDHVC